MVVAAGREGNLLWLWSIRGGEAAGVDDQHGGGNEMEL